MDKEFKQYIIVRKDLNMSPQKMSAMVAHGAMAFLTSDIRSNAKLNKNNDKTYISELTLDKDLFDNWFNGAFTKVVLEAKNKYQLLKAKTMAEEIGMIEGKDFFLIKDKCLTELTPEEIDENGIGRTLTCIGFRPFTIETMKPISKKYQLYK
jgi:PTH2 family peptidyl-tRNA hydrolase